MSERKHPESRGYELTPFEAYLMTVSGTRLSSIEEETTVSGVIYFIKITEEEYKKLKIDQLKLQALENMRVNKCT